MKDRFPDIDVGFVAAGRYELVRQIGIGGMGSVYEATDRRLGKAVAIKLLDPGLVNNRELIKRFEREARLAASLRHDNICDVSDFGLVEEAIPFLVMELLDGEPLTELMRRQGVIRPSDAGEIMLQVLAALGSVHLSAAVHRDLKPDNIFLTRSSRGKLRVKLIDFGIAKIASGTNTGTAIGQVIGTVYYMSPEQAEGSVDRVDPRSDIWSAGVILYEMLSGKLPFVGDTLREVMGGILFKEPPPVRTLVPAIPEPLSDVVCRAMAKEQEDRFPDTDIFASALEGAIGHPETRAFEHDLGATNLLSTSPAPAIEAETATAEAPRAPHDHKLGSSLHPAEVQRPPPSQGRGKLVVVAVALAFVLLGVLVGGSVAAYYAISSRSTTAPTRQATATSPPPQAQETSPAPIAESTAQTGVTAGLSSTSTSAGLAIDDAGTGQPDAKTISTPQLVALRLESLPAGAVVTFDGQPIEDGQVRGVRGHRGELVVQAEGYEELRQQLELQEVDSYDLSDHLRPIEPATKTAQRSGTGRRQPPRPRDPPPSASSRQDTRWRPPSGYRPPPSSRGGIYRTVPSATPQQGSGIVRTLP